MVLATKMQMELSTPCEDLSYLIQNAQLRRSYFRAPAHDNQIPRPCSREGQSGAIPQYFAAAVLTGRQSSKPKVAASAGP